MKFLDRWLYGKVRDMWDNRDKYDMEREYNEVRKMKMAAGQIAIPSVLSKGAPEGEDRITFELSSAVGGRILNVRRYDNRTDRHDQTTYVIPSGEDVGARVAKIVNLEMIKS